MLARTNKNKQTCMQSLLVTATCVFCFLLPHPLSTVKTNKLKPKVVKALRLHHDWEYCCYLLDFQAVQAQLLHHA